MANIVNFLSTKIYPGVDGVTDLGDATHNFKDLYLTGTITAISALTLTGNLTVTGTSALKGNVTIGIGAAGTDYTLTFDGESNDGVITWMEDENYFKLTGLYVNGSSTLYGAVTLGSASTSDITCTGRLVLRTLGADPKAWAAASRPAGTTKEIAYYGGALYYCIDGSVSEWRKLAVEPVNSPSPSLSPSKSPSYSPSSSESKSPSASISSSPSSSYSPSESPSVSESSSPSPSTPP